MEILLLLYIAGALVVTFVLSELEVEDFPMALTFGIIWPISLTIFIIKGLLRHFVRVYYRLTKGK